MAWLKNNFHGVIFPLCCCVHYQVEKHSPKYHPWWDFIIIIMRSPPLPETYQLRGNFIGRPDGARTYLCIDRFQLVRVRWKFIVGLSIDRANHLFHVPQLIECQRLSLLLIIIINSIAHTTVCLSLHRNGATHDRRMRGNSIHDPFGSFQCQASSLAINQRKQVAWMFPVKAYHIMAALRISL